jgi:NNP family nitrate/nitrite transporter-like MFS transporter
LAGGLGGFFPPLVLGVLKDRTGSYAVGFILLALVAALCLILNLLVLGSGGTRRGLGVSSQPA